MSQNHISDFKIWAIKMGLPSHLIPEDSTLKPLFKGKQGVNIVNMMEKVRPKQEVRKIRENILIQKVNNIGDEVIPVYARDYLPQQLKTYLMLNDTVNRKVELEKELDETLHKYHSFITQIGNKNYEKMQLSQISEEKLIKINILNEKFESLERDTENLKYIRDKIISITPIRPQSNFDEKKHHLVNEAVKHFEQFYVKCSDSTQNVQNLQVDLMKKLTPILDSEPNYIFWKVLLHNMDKNSKFIKYLPSVSSTNNCLEDSFLLPNDNNMDLKKCITLSLAEVIAAKCKLWSLQKDNEIMNAEFLKLYDDFVTSIRNQINLTNKNEQENVDVDELAPSLSYVGHLISHYGQKSFIQYLKKEINDYEKLIERNNETVKSHHELKMKLNKLQDDIRSRTSQLQLYISVITDFKNKMYNFRNHLKHTFKSDKVTDNSSRKFESTIDSLNNSDILCSTKLDCTTRISPPQIQNEITANLRNLNIVYPSDINELNTFNDIPIEKFCSILKEYAFYCQQNPISNQTLKSISFDKMHSLPLITTEGLIRMITIKKHFELKLKKFIENFKIYTEPLKDDENDYTVKQIEHVDVITEILDKTQIREMNIKQLLNKIEKYFNFYSDCPLKNYIPSTDLFNGKTYTDYETEYLMLYRMATGNSLAQGGAMKK